MSSLRQLLPLAALLASFEPLLTSPPLFALESASPPSRPASTRAETAPPDAGPLRPFIEALEAEIRKLRQERDDWEAKAVVCQARLQRATDSLNQLALPDLATVGDPELQVAGTDVVVTSHLINLADQLSRGTAAIDLLLDDKVVASAREPVSVAASSGLTVTHLFKGLAGKGKLSAKVSLEP